MRSRAEDAAIPHFRRPGPTPGVNSTRRGRRAPITRFNTFTTCRTTHGSSRCCWSTRGSGMAEKGRCGLLVLHSSPLIRKAILDLFRGDPGVTVLGGCPHPTAVGSLPGRRPDVALVEYEQWQGVAAIWRTGAAPGSSSTAGTTPPAAWWIGIRGGAAGFVHESCPPESIVKGLHDVLSGRSFWHLGADEPERAPVAQRPDAGGQWKLSGREEILASYSVVAPTRRSPMSCASPSRPSRTMRAESSTRWASPGARSCSGC
ncbi:hypothetical protein SMICM304S_03931 [Streptomyces microflavus]